MDNCFEREEKLLFDLLALVFSDKAMEEQGGSGKYIIEKYGDIDWQKFFKISENHCVLSLLYDVLEGGENLSGELQNRLQSVSETTALQNYHLLFLGKTVTELLKKENIDVVLLKGSDTSQMYPVPEMRKSGDVDILLLRREDSEKAEELLTGAGLKREKEQLANHHVGFITKDGIELELHTMLTEPFDNNKSNRFFEDIYKMCKDHACEKEIMGVMLPVLDDEFHIFYLLLHMLQHFLRSGFGLKLFCDWVAFWRQDNITEAACRNFMSLVEESGLTTFVKTVTAACVGYLGLNPVKVKFMFGRVITPEEARRQGKALMLEVLEAEEFGKSSADRMVMVRDDSLIGLIREFHHQMHLNFPAAGKVFICWPVLWVITLVRFQKNNKRLRNISSRAILKKAKERSRLMEELELFK